MNLKWPNGRSWVQFLTVFISLGISQLAEFFCFLSAHLYPDQFFYKDYLDIISKWRIQDGRSSRSFFNNEWRHHDITAIVKGYYYSFKIFPQLWLAKSTRITHHNQLLMTKFGRILCLTRKWRQKCSLPHVNAPLTEKIWDEIEMFSL